MKKLKKILLINWLYFSRELIEVGDVNFLTGKNGAGKSTVIDALQIVLLGETNARNFNQAANEKSQRTLDGYLRADMDDHNPYSRRGKDFSSYIACEFYDDLDDSSFVTGIHFDCRSDGSEQHHFFIYRGTLPDHCFIVDQTAMSTSELRAFLKNYPRAKVYDSHREYRSDMLSYWNVHSEQALRMMKKAVSFRPIVDIQKFITENICDIPDKPDIEAMQQNIRDYKRHELLAQQQQERLTALREISEHYQIMTQAIDRWRANSFLVHWSKKELQQEKIDRAESETCSTSAAIAVLAEEIDALSSEISEKETHRRELERACAQSSVFQEEERLHSRRQSLLDEQARLMHALEALTQEIQREAQRWNAQCSVILAWDSEESLLSVQHAAQTVYKAYSRLLDADNILSSEALPYLEAAQDASEQLSAVMRSTAHKIEDLLAHLETQVNQKQNALTNLRRNIKDYPKGLTSFRARLATELNRQLNRPVSLDILADMLEVTDERWRGAAEGYLNTQKFYLLTVPSCYPDALAAYDRIKHEFPSQPFGLVDVGKLEENENLTPQENSLAQKIETDSPLARSYIDYLLGHVICCETAEELREHRTAITAEGMLYHGYTARMLRRERMEDAFLGRRAVALRIERMEAELADLHKELAHWTPIYQTLSEQKPPLLTEYFLQNTLAQHRADSLRTLELQAGISELDDQLSRLNLLWLEEQRRSIAALTEEIGSLSKVKETKIYEKGSLEERVRTLEMETLPEHYQQLSAAENRLAEEFTQDYRDRIGIPRYQQELSVRKQANAVCQHFSGELSESASKRDTAMRKLFAARREYVDRFRPCPFRVEAMDNAEFAAEQSRLEESELPNYQEKIKAARESALEQFQNDFLAKLKSNINLVQEQVKDLNRALQQARFGTDRYQFRVDRNPDYADYYDMILASEGTGEGGLFALPFQEKYGSLIEKLFSQITMADDTQLNTRKQSELQENIQRYTDFRTYLTFDLETTDQNGSKQLLSQTLNTKSGGETQTPFYIAVLASFAQLYRVNDSSALGNTVRLVVFDEAFNKMDSDRIVESVRLLRKMGLQAIICTPPEKAADIMPAADRTLLVSKEQYRMRILPFCKQNAQ